jgi:hypothetical protein
LDRNGEYRDLADKEFSDKLEMERLLQLSARLPAETKKKLVDKAINDRNAS